MKISPTLARTSRVSRTSFLALAALAFAGGLFSPSAARAEAPSAPAQQKTQVPGFYRMMLGQFEITALYDGYIMIDKKVLTGASADDLQSLLARMFVASENGMQTAVNAFLVNTGTRLVLIDSGAANAFGPTLGNIVANLRAAGYGPEQVDAVFLTHLHADHARGLITLDGSRVFTNATVYVSKAEAAFWLDETIAAKAPAERQAFFKFSREAVAPYVAAGKLKIYEKGDTLMPGLEALEMPGHTPGHISYLVKSGEQYLLIWGDIVHSHAAQFAHPEIAAAFDSDSTQAIATRKRIFALAAENKLWIAGAHLPFPGIGHVRAEKAAYAWVPIEYAPVLTGGAAPY